ncbi:hypothetical protein MRB53_038318 [Persea americana]|nr:hypothetical protein MRB53_038318 [Persea americana]
MPHRTGLVFHVTVRGCAISMPASVPHTFGAAPQTFALVVTGAIATDRGAHFRVLQAVIRNSRVAKALTRSELQLCGAALDFANSEFGCVGVVAALSLP